MGGVSSRASIAYADARKARAIRFIEQNALVAELLADETHAVAAKRNDGGTIDFRDFAILNSDQTMSVSQIEAALARGWNAAEDWAVWSGEGDAWLRFGLGSGLRMPFVLDMEFFAYLPEDQDQDLAILGRTGPLATASYAGHKVRQKLTCLISQNDLDDQNIISLCVSVATVRSPAEYGDADSRFLGVALSEVTARNLPEPTESNVFGTAAWSPPLLEHGVPLDPHRHLRDALSGHGWSHMEEIGVWSVNPEANVSFRVPRDLMFPVLLDIILFAVLIGSDQQQAVILSGDRCVGRAQFSQDAEERQKVQVRLGPRDVGRDGLATLTVVAARYVPPSEAGLSPDPRTLGVRLAEVRLSGS